MKLSMDDYAVSRCRRLEQKNFHPYQPWQERSELAVAEKGKNYRLKIGKELSSAVFQVDGEIITAGAKCDKFVGIVKKGEESKGVAIFVELKGQDIGHAVDQLESTIRNTIFIPFPNKDDIVRARIVTSGCGPKSSSRVKFEKARIRFKREYNVDLSVLKNNQYDQPLNL